jgi:DNA-binding MarR family transcriptional regulator
LVKISESDLNSALNNLKELNLKFEQLQKELKDLRNLHDSEGLNTNPRAKVKESKKTAASKDFSKSSAASQSKAANLGFIPQDTDIGPKAKYFLCTLLAQASRKIIAYYNRELNSLGISAQQLIALGVLEFQKDVTLGKFAERMKISTPSALNMLRRLEAMELITIEPHPSDGRLNIFKPTAKAGLLFPKIHKKVKGFEAFLESKAGASSLERLVADLSKLLSLDF